MVRLLVGNGTLGLKPYIPRAPPVDAMARTSALRPDPHSPVVSAVAMGRLGLKKELTCVLSSENPAAQRQNKCLQRTILGKTAPCSACFSDVHQVFINFMPGWPWQWLTMVDQWTKHCGPPVPAAIFCSCSKTPVSLALGSSSAATRGNAQRQESPVALERSLGPRNRLTTGKSLTAWTLEWINEYK